MAEERSRTKSEIKHIFRGLKNKPITDEMISVLIDFLYRDPVNLRTSGFEFPGHFDSVISLDTNTKIFKIIPFDPLVEGHKPRYGIYSWSGTTTFNRIFFEQTIQVPTEEGLYCIYFSKAPDPDRHQILYVIKNPTEIQLADLYTAKIIVSFIYYDATNNEILHFGDDRHGSEWNPQIQTYIQEAFGARRKSGLQFTGYVIDGNGSLDAHAKISVTGGLMLHSDIELTIPSRGPAFEILYCFGGLPRFTSGGSYGFAGAPGLSYNNGANNIAQATPGAYVLYHYFATNEKVTTSRKIISVMGTTPYAKLGAAFYGINRELDVIKSYMPMRGRCYIGTVIYQTSPAFTNNCKVRIVAVSETIVHPPVTIDENTKELLEIDEKQILSIPGDFETDKFYAIKNRLWQKITAGGLPDAPADGNKYARQDNTWVTIIDGIDGEDGREVEISTEAGFIVWRYVGDLSWIQLCPIPLGADGDDGITPHVGINGNWYFGETDTGVKAQGEDGSDANVVSGLGMDFIDGEPVDLGLPSTITATTTNLLTETSHTHELDLSEITKSDLPNVDIAPVDIITDVIEDVNSGALYNWFAATDPRKITGSDDWVVPDWNQYTILQTTIGGSTQGGKLKEAGFIHWESPNTNATNEVGFNAKGTGDRAADGTFSQFMHRRTTYFQSENLNETLVYSSVLNFNDGNFTVWVWCSKRSAQSLRLLYVGTGAPTEYIGNDGKIYRVVTIGTQTWLADNLNETKFRNSDWIHGFDDGVYTPMSNPTWAALTGEGMCYYSDNEANGSTTVVTTLKETLTDIQDQIDGIPEATNGITPHIGVNGNWYFGETDSGIPAKGPAGADGDDGITPHIGVNANWYFGESDTGIKAQGEDGLPGANGIDIGGGFEFCITPGTAQTETIDLFASANFTISSIVLESNGNLNSVTIKIGATAITGVNAIAVSTLQVFAATGNNAVAAGNRITIEIGTAYSGSPTIIRGKILA